MCPTAPAFALLCLIIIFPGGQSASPSTLTVCRDSKFTIECPTTPTVSAINIQSVFYGRRDLSICAPALVDRVNCSLDSAIDKVKRLCNGEPNCTLYTDKDYFPPNPCEGTTKYLQITYDCLPDCAPPCATCLGNGSCTSCIAGHILVSGNTCTPCRTCGPFQYDEGGCCGTMDRICRDCVRPCETCSDATTCSACESGFYLNSNSSVCQECTRCAPNQFESTVCFRSTNRQCTGCQSPCATCSGPTTCESCITGYYLDYGKTCRACRTCTAIQYETKACSSSNDRQCSDTYGQRCADQTFLDKNPRQCLPWLCSRKSNVLKKYKGICDNWRCSIYISYRKRFPQRCARLQGAYRL